MCVRPGVAARFDVVRYGALPYDAADPERYPLFAVKTKHWSASKPCVLAGPDNETNNSIPATRVSRCHLSKVTR